jgi:hypothetical protein
MDENRRARIAVNLRYFRAQRIGDVWHLLWFDTRAGRIFGKRQKTKNELKVSIHAWPRLTLVAPRRRPSDATARHVGHYDPETVAVPFTAKRT